MPLYEFRCAKCGSRDEVFVRSVSAAVAAPQCKNGTCGSTAPMERAMSKFARHLTEMDKVAVAESKWGKQAADAFGPEPDISKYIRRYDRLSKDLPPPDEVTEL